jgi:hypothetical protein
MKKLTAISLSLTLGFSSISFAKVAATAHPGGYFLENKGQITDQYLQPRHDIQFALQGNGLTVFIGSGNLHYQFAQNAAGSTVPDEYAIIPPSQEAARHPGYKKMLPRQMATYRMDVELLGMNKDAVPVAENAIGYYENYYLPGTPANGITAHAFQKITYRNAYPGIDWVITIKEGKLEHEFVVGANGNPADIRIRYKGQTDILINKDGSITATTPMGAVNEHAPVCYNAKGAIAVAYVLNGNTVSYKIEGTGSMVIDPELQWATYYGADSSTTDFYGCASDGMGHIYAGGLTWCATSITTTGAFQNVIGGPANSDAFLVKFDTSGNRIWSTYYGGNGGDWGVSVACDPAGSVYMAGVTQSSLTGIATPGAQQTVYGGGLEDGFLVKFAPDGSRRWATYIGGTGAEIPASVVCDLSGHVYLGGFTTGSNTNIATAGSHQPTSGGGYEDYLVQYDTAGVRQWGTYYGGSSNEFGGALCTDGIYVYLSGYTFSSGGIASVSSYQTTLGGGSDAFIAKFNSLGGRAWGTYYGGPAAETAGGITCDPSGAVFLLGATSSDAGIASTGCFQSVRSGSLPDAFLAKFDPELGMRDWATYFGGPGSENTDLSRITTDADGNVYITGYTASTSGIASTDGWQTVYGGGTSDAFFAKFMPNGLRFWSTYYGGSNDDLAKGLCYDGVSVYICGKTSSPNNIATPGSFLPAISGVSASYYFGFLAKVHVIDPPSPTLSAAEVGKDNGAGMVYPNPGNGSFAIACAAPVLQGAVQITVADISGRIVLTQQARVEQGRIVAEVTMPASAAPGMYEVRLTTGNFSRTFKYQKQ